MAVNNTGWLCPRCQRVNAPWRDECRCNDERPGTTASAPPGVSPFRWSPGTGTWPWQWETTTATQTSPSDWTIINGTFTMLASEAVLRREWDTPAEDAAWRMIEEEDAIMIESGILPALILQATKYGDEFARGFMDSLRPIPTEEIVDRITSELAPPVKYEIGMNKYNYRVMWSDEDEGYIATVAEFPLLSAFGETAEDAIREMNVVLEAVDVPDNHQLLPCPFCGGEAWFASDDVTWWAGCEPCGVELTGTTDKIETFAMWNRRA